MYTHFHWQNTCRTNVAIHCHTTLLQNTKCRTKLHIYNHQINIWAWRCDNNDLSSGPLHVASFWWQLSFRASLQTVDPTDETRCDEMLTATSCLYASCCTTESHRTQEATEEKYNLTINLFSCGAATSKPTPVNWKRFNLYRLLASNFVLFNNVDWTMFLAFWALTRRVYDVHFTSENGTDREFRNVTMKTWRHGWLCYRWGSSMDLLRQWNYNEFLFWMNALSITEEFQWICCYRFNELTGKFHASIVRHHVSSVDQLSQIRFNKLCNQIHHWLCTEYVGFVVAKGIIEWHVGSRRNAVHNLPAMAM